VHVALISSPVLGTAVWEPVAQLLEQAGHRVQCVAAGRVPGSGADYAEQVLEALPHDRRWVLVAHSNAGAIIPVVSARRDVAALVFVDAILPPAEGSQPLAPPAFLPFLESIASSGVLPEWTRWWDSVDELFPSPDVRTAVEAQQLRLPLEYFASSIDVPAGWDSAPGWYLAFGDTYAVERADAAARGWHVTTLDGAHLHQLVDPAAVAAVIVWACAG